MGEFFIAFIAAISLSFHPVVVEIQVARRCAANSTHCSFASLGNIRLHYLILSKIRLLSSFMVISYDEDEIEGDQRNHEKNAGMLDSRCK